MTDPISNRDLPAPEPFRTGAIDLAGTRVVWCAGELDLAGEELLRTTIDGALGGSPGSVVLDLRSLTFTDCTVVRCIEYAHETCTAKGVLLFVDPGPIVTRLVNSLDPRLLGPVGWLLEERSLAWSDAGDG